MEDQAKMTFTVQRGSEVVEVIGRKAAVERARELSEGRRRVVVESTDGTVQMLYSDGSLQSMVAQSPRRGRRR